MYRTHESLVDPISDGIAIVCETFGGDFDLTVFPFRVPTPLPKIVSANVTSSVTTGLFAIALVAMASLRSAILGLPEAISSSLARFARLTSLGV